MTDQADRFTVLIVPGLRDAVDDHWQTLLQRDLRKAARPVASVLPMGRENLSCSARVAEIERTAQSIEGPIVAVAHSGGCIMLAHWARRTKRAVRGALLATPPDFEKPMPEGYPTMDALRAGGWLPVPRKPLPFPSIVGASRNDPLARFSRVTALASDWGSEVVDLGSVGHLNPASGYGQWTKAESLIARLGAAALN
jgi:predicted alpha/beta hydrolase family esterase